MENLYKNLAERNGWIFSMDDNNRPYFMDPNGGYAVPNETTTTEDKYILARIISEGSMEMEKLILLCWENKIGISGPCSGIKEYHVNPPFSVHFSFTAGKDIIEPLLKALQELLPDFDHLPREKDGLLRYDLSYFLDGKVLTKEQSNEIFKVIREQLEHILEQKKNENKEPTV